MTKLKITGKWDGNIFGVWGETNAAVERAPRKTGKISSEQAKIIVKRLETEVPQSKDYYEALGKCLNALREAGYEVS